MLSRQRPWLAARLAMSPSATVRRVVFALSLATAAVILSARGFYEPDLWWHLAQGRENAAGHLVRSNTFSVLFPDYRQHYTSWLFDTVAFVAWTLGGPAGIQLVQALLVALALGVTYRACRLRGPASASAAILVLGFFVLEPRAIPRPHLVSFAGLAACTFAIESARVRRSILPLAWTIPLVAVWSNFHVEVVFGVLAVGLAALGEWIRPASWPPYHARHATLVAIGCIAATLVTPYGWGLVLYLYENTAVPAMLTISELQPAYLPNYRAFWIYIALAAALLAVPPRRIDLRDVLTLVVFAALGARHLRLTPLVFFATAPALTARLAELSQRGWDRRAVLITAAVLGLVSSRVPPHALITNLRVGAAAVRPQAYFSDGAVSFVRRESLHGPLFNSNNLGGDLAWSLYPDARIFQDSRLQAYPPGFFLAIVKASRDQADWDVLTSAVDWAVVSLARPGELSGVGRFPRSAWATVYWDEAAQVIVRREGQYAPVAARNEYAVVLPGVDPFGVVARLRTENPERIRAEARRNRVENPRGYLAPAILCLSGEDEACADLDRLALDAPALREAIDRVRRVRR
jgi:hypothetical protein